MKKLPLCYPFQTLKEQNQTVQLTKIKLSSLIEVFNYCTSHYSYSELKMKTGSLHSTAVNKYLNLYFSELLTYILFLKKIQ